MRNLFEKELELKKMDDVIKLSNGSNGVGEEEEEENDNENFYYRLVSPIYTHILYVEKKKENSIINTGDNYNDTEQLSNSVGEEDNENKD